MSEILSPKEYKKKLSKEKNTISKHNINFNNFKNDRKKKLSIFSIVYLVIYALVLFINSDSILSLLVAISLPVFYIGGSPALIQYVRGDLNYINWIWYSIGMAFLGIGFIILLFFLPPEDRLEKEYKEFMIKKKIKE